ncbi:hypothetical protein FC35_GL001234 [Limosilactobacillus coleohominis DSM 14060]|nr:hypothetical protein FC35_GL001234 [Limosilactobacillus coleohominis DSM 14060]
MNTLQQQLIDALKQSANGQYPTTIRHLHPLLEKLGWSLEQLTEVANELDNQGIITAKFASNKLKSIALSADFPDLI